MTFGSTMGTARCYGRESVSGSPRLITIHRALISEIEQLVALQWRSTLAGYPATIRQALVDRPDIIAQNFRQDWILKDQLLVAELDGVIAGFAVIDIDDDVFDEAELTLLFVDPGRWRHGVGTALVQAAIGKATEWGAKRIHVLANPLSLQFH